MRPFLALVCLLAFSLPRPAHACLTRILVAPPVLAGYMNHTLGETNDPLQVLANSFRADKAYYDALTGEMCSLGMHDDSVEDAMAHADAKVMDQIFDKWQKIGAALTAAQKNKAAEPPSCNVEADCKDYCAALAKQGECLPNGITSCTAGKCGCALTCR